MEASSIDLLREQVRTITTKDGASASLEGGDDRIVVRDGAERVLFEYLSEGGRCVVYAPTGDLVLRAAQGAVEIEGAEGVRLKTGSELSLAAGSLKAQADRAEIELEEAHLTGRVLSSAFGSVRQTVDLLELRAGRVVERAQETFREVESLAQLRAGRIRQLSAKTFHLFGERLLLMADKDARIDGEKIHLG